MKQLWYINKDAKTVRERVELRDVPVPELASDFDVKVKLAYAALCATDVHMMTQGVFGAEPPMPLGHEGAGTVVEAGPRAAAFGFAPGDRVTLLPHGSCGMCPMCKRGLRQYCRMAHPTSAFAEYLVTDVSAVFKIPGDGDLKNYTLTEPAGCTVRAMDLTPIPHGATVCVAGIGGIGSILLNQVILSGASQITAIDPVPEKRRLALEMGAQYAIDPFGEDVKARAMEITDGFGYDIVFEASGSPKAARTPLDILAQCGTASYFAVFPPDFDFPVNLYDLFMKEGRIQTVFFDPTNQPRTISLIPRLQTDKIIGKIMPLSDAAEALELFEQSIYPKILLDCAM